MDIGATLTSRETQTITRRLNTISRLTDERRIREQCRMIACDINKGARRVSKKKQDLKLF